jgi:hypothetical protein
MPSSQLTIGDRHRAAVLACDFLDPARWQDAWEALPRLATDVHDRLGKDAMAEFILLFGREARARVAELREHLTEQRKNA